ncbi:squalene--hopene cyclase [Stieleria sp. JC731]|uniref:squalene--hopene cyclase n=1 Tax=Pirellulaceae TaxID=2691357 RepID=UPI001E286601|nr:squalene--hopene cyclase [Stieleria sp. JC731]MCC9602064.1 squalene--hopene cyclase [Stieleria sp. JC731]
MILATSIDTIWSDPRVVYAVAVAAVVLLVVTIWLFRRAKREGRAAGTICLILSVVLHGVLIWLVPYKQQPPGGGKTASDREETLGIDSIEMSTFDPKLQFEDNSGDADQTPFMPLPVDDLTDLASDSVPAPGDDTPPEADSLLSESSLENSDVPQSLESEVQELASEAFAEIEQALDASLDELIEATMPVDEAEMAAPESVVSDVPDIPAMVDPLLEPPPLDEQPMQMPTAQTVSSKSVPVGTSGPMNPADSFDTTPHSAANAPSANIAADRTADFSSRTGTAKQIAIEQTGGDAQTEAAVRAALRFLADAQQANGSWDPQATGAGEERRPLGENRFGAGKRCTTALTGLSLLAMMGAGNTHQRGEYSENVYQGLSYLIQHQQPNGSLEGGATLYAASYCHSMATLAVCEDALMTGDASAVECARRAIAHTKRMQHPVTGGWRYTRGDPGDLSQLGWQAMALHSGYRAGVAVGDETFAGVQRFLRSVQVGGGGLACYRPGEKVSRTMTAEAMAIRLLLGERMSAREVAEAERYILQQRPGVGQDNYYFWYYATLALHQLQDDAWQEWNLALKQRLLATQRADGSWPNTSLWGGYGGPVYTTAMATLCLETYYRHTVQ